MQQIADALAQKGFVIIDNFFDDWKILKQEAEKLAQNNAFSPAFIGQGNTQQHNIMQRGDNIFWLDKDNFSPTQKAFFEKMDTLQSFLNQNFFWGTNEVEMHFAIYDQNMFYQKHLDNFKIKNTRRLSFVLYLNENWVPENGGELRIYSNETDYTNIQPIGGRLACFVSTEIWHEVLPTLVPRYSLTGWLRRNNDNNI
jgi:SM-20-related protein